MSTAALHIPAAGERWLARLALACAAAAALLPLAAAGWRGLLLPLAVAGQLVLVVVGAWLALAHRGVVRVVGVVLAVAAVAVVTVLEIGADLLWVVVVAAVLLLLGAAAGRTALRRGRSPYATPERDVPPPRRPFLIMNPRSGGGKVARFGLREKAEALGADVVVLDGPDFVDVAALARHAVERGADLLGVAGGDGTQALVAAVAAEHDTPLLVISAGTRNHFALDLGLDREDPARCLDALRDGVELRVDLGDVNGRPFVNNVSFGAYATIVERPEYREEKLRTTLDLLPDLLSASHGVKQVTRAGTVIIDGAQALLVSNNPYGTGDITGLGRRPRVDAGVLGVIGVRARNALEAARMLRGAKAPGLTVLVAEEVVVDSPQQSIPAGVDGESVRLTTPVRCRVRPAALRVRVPRDRPGVPPAGPSPRLRALARLSLPVRHPGP
ncbi:MAG TPA: diacylglycerol kinase family protein [Mycobacteriales bacterium]|nr:diacylglycerol kinase family protein [Mycobacteriales bacterium]